jgi:hypothetical protein
MHMQTWIIGLIVAATSQVARAHAGGGAAGTARGPGGIFVVDRPAPGLELPTVDGRATIALGELRGSRVIVLQFASW